MPAGIRALLKPAHFERVFITEKLSVALTLAAHLGTPRQLDGFVVVGRDALTWCQGHLLELCMPEDYSPRYKSWAFGGRQGRLLPIIPRTWRKKPTAAGRARLPIIEGLVRRTGVVVHAGDPDREGQLIVDEVLRWLGYDGQVVRLRLLGMDRASIDAAFGKLTPNSEFVALGTAAQKRGEADWTLGINASRTYTIGARRQTGFHRVISVGRVQTPTLALVAKRDQAIAEFRSAPYFQVVTQLQADGAIWMAPWRPPPGIRGLDSEGRLTDLATARAVAALLTGAAGTVSARQDDELVHPPPLPYNLSALQIACSAAFDYSPKRTLVIAQQLYDTYKVATYPRTDCRYLPESQLAGATRLLASLGTQLRSLAHALALADATRPSRAWDDGKLGAHHAIVPTGAGEIEGLPDDALRVYQRIALRYVMQFTPPLRLRRRTLEASLGGTFLVGVSATRVVDAGWSALEEPAIVAATGHGCACACRRHGRALHQRKGADVSHQAARTLHGGRADPRHDQRGRAGRRSARAWAPTRSRRSGHRGHARGYSQRAVRARLPHQRGGRHSHHAVWERADPRLARRADQT